MRIDVNKHWPVYLDFGRAGSLSLQLYWTYHRLLHMRVVVKNHALPVYKKNRIASLLCIFESTILWPLKHKSLLQPCTHLKAGHHRPASVTPFRWRFADWSMVARYCMLAGRRRCSDMSRDMRLRFPTMWYVRSAKPQISLRIRAVWSEPLLVVWMFYEC